jgi:hypothetical protein
LNGNKLTFILLLFFFGLSSACSSNRTVASIPSTNLLDFSANSRILVDKLDTLPIVPFDSELSLPVGSDLVKNKMPTEEWQMSNSKISEVENFKIGFVLPFLTDKLEASNLPDFNNSVSRWAIHYYTGAKLALDNWKNKGVKFESLVWDSGADTLSLNRNVFSDARFFEVPILIGPYHRDNVKYLANYAKKAGVLMFSPFSAAQILTEENPFFYQVNPQLETQIASIVEHINEYASMDEVLILQKDVDVKLQNLFLQSFESNLINNSWEGLPKSILLSGNNVTWSKSLTPELAKREKLVVIISSYTDEVFLNNLLQELNRETFDKKEIIVYGLSPWLNLERLDFQILESLNFHVASPYYINERNDNVSSFKLKFFQELGTFPQPEAFQGYDLVNLLIENWLENSAHFQENLEFINPANYLSSPYQFKKIKSNSLNNEKWNFNMNQNIVMLKFSDFRWQKD